MERLKRNYLYLCCGFLLSVGVPLIVSAFFPWPSGTTNGTKYSITGVLILLCVGVWGVFYQKVRRTERDYLTRKSKLGISILVIVIGLCFGIALGNFVILQNETVADITFAEAWYYPAYTRFNLTLAQLFSQFGRFLGIVMFQLVILMVFVGCALGFRPKHQSENPQRDFKMGSLYLGIGISIVVILSILAASGLGYVWVGTEGRFFLLQGFYPEHFSVVLIPNIILMVFGSSFYLAFRKNFASEVENSSNKKVMKRYILVGIALFNGLFASRQVFPELVLNYISIAYFLFLLLQMLVSTSVINMIEANRAKMGTPLTRKFGIASLAYLFGFIVATAVYILAFTVFDMAIYTDLSEILAYYPNLIFGALLTAGLYHLGLYFETKIKKEGV